jgi:hypothetical protein
MQNDAAVALLIQHGADVNAKGPDGTPLQVASADGNEKMVRLLLANDAKINAVGPNGTALQAAALWGHHNIVRILVDHDEHARKCEAFRTFQRQHDSFTASLIKHAVVLPKSNLLTSRRLVQHRRTSWSY